MSEAKSGMSYRHRLPVRIMHWINVLCVFVLLMSGLQIFNAHPALYWGMVSNFSEPALALTAKRAPDGGLRGETKIGGVRLDTTGVLGVSGDRAGAPTRRGFPMWATIPGPRNLAQGRRWHFFFAWLFVINGLTYWAWSWRSRHLSQDLKPSASDWRGIGKSVWDHMRFKHPVGIEATRYNVLQKLAYLSVIFILLPGIVLMGLAMSPQLDSVLGWMVDLVGGRQSARTWHFIIAFALVAFVLIHVLMVIVSGPVNQIRSMITGRYRIPEDPTTPAAGDDHVQ